MNVHKNAAMVLLACALYGPLSANSSWNPFGNEVKKGEGGVETNVVKKCSDSKGTIALNEPAHLYYLQANVPNPQILLKPMIQNSSCFRLVNRGAAVRTMKAERAFGDDGELQKGSHMGGGQIKAADYSLVADVALSDGNTSCSTIGAAAGGTFGAVGAIVGGVANKPMSSSNL